MSTQFGGTADAGGLAPSAKVDTSTKPRIFKIQQGDLYAMFEKTTQRDARLTRLRELGYAQNILIGINSEASTGIVGDVRDLERRKAVYGANNKPLPPPSSILESFKQEVRNLLWVVIGATAAVAAVCGIFAKGAESLLEGIFLCVFAFLMILMNSVVDYCKDKKYIQLQSLMIDETIIVNRGKFGSFEQISIWELVVGDVIMIGPGQRVPGDCLVLEASDFKVDESVDEKFRLQKDDQGYNLKTDVKLDSYPKAPYLNERSTADPFVRADAMVTGGHATLLICCTGEKSTRGSTTRKLEDDSVNTNLQQVLKNLTSQFTQYSLIACFIILLVLMIVGVIASTVKTKGIDANDSNDWVASLFEKLPTNINLFVVLVVVAIPEGLPLTIQISLAFSVMRMYRQDRILLRKQDALEKMAEANDFIIGKSNILTTGKMKVKQFYLECSTKMNARPDTFLNCELDHSTIKLVQEGILYNNSAYVEMGEKKFVPVGDGTEVGLLKFLQNADIPIHTEINRRYDVERVIAQVPMRFATAGQFFTACAVDEQDGFVNIHIKGAPDALLPLATGICGEAGAYLDLDEGTQASFLEEVDKMAATPLRVIAFAHADIPRADWDNIVAQRQGDSANEILASILVPGSGLGIKIVGALGLEDKVRPKAKSALSHAIGPVEDPRITVRMISGDALPTAQAVALQVGLVTERQVKEARDPAQGQHQSVIMHAQQFDEATRKGEDKTALTRVLSELKVLAKATPEHRRIVIEGLQELFPEENKKVLVTGGGIADVEALNRADVALAMGSGCSAAKELADIVLTGDDFEATLRAVMWGRNIYHNVARFLQFQVTVNLSCLMVVFVAPMLLGESPFSAVQLLWLNLVMDSLAAFALGTEPPLPNVTAGKPYSDQQVMRPEVWRQILGMSLWNFLTILCVLVFAPLTMGMFKDHMYTMADPAGAGLGEDVLGVGQDARVAVKLKHCTYLYHIFVFLQLFNLINCRKDGATDYNVFGRFFHNWYFLAVLCGEFAFQFLFPATMIRTSVLNQREWGACLMVGATPLLVSVLLKCTPTRWLRKLQGGPCGIVDEKKQVSTRLTKAFDQVGSMTVGGSKAEGADDGYAAMDKDKKEPNAGTKL